MMWTKGEFEDIRGDIGARSRGKEKHERTCAGMMVGMDL